MMHGDHIDFRDSMFNGPVVGKVEHYHVSPARPTATSALPPPPAVFTGRDGDIEALLEALDPTPDDASPAVLVSTISGLGGTGKTALALQAAHTIRARFPGGTLFLNMRGYDDPPVPPEEAVLSLLRALGVQEQYLPAVSAERYSLYRSVLETRESLLIVLDNVSAASQVVPLLPGSTRHRVLVTSRDSLDSLTARSVTLDALSQEEAVGLIEQSLSVRAPSDTRVHDEPAAVRRLVDLCGGLPLALHIAAALLHRGRPRPVSTLVDELQSAADRVRALCAPGEDQYGTQLALHPVFEVTYHRLGADLARLFRLLAQAPTSDFGLATAQALTSMPLQDLRRRLDDLTAAFLISPSPVGDRWSMHDLLRSYASSISAGKQSLIKEAATGRDGLLRHFLLHAASADQHLRGQLLDSVPDLFSSRYAALAWLETEHASLVGATLWAENQEHSRLATALGVCVERYLHLQRHFADGMIVFEALLVAARRDRDQVLEIFSLTALGNARFELRQYREAAIDHTNALRLAYALADRSGQAAIWTNLGRCMQAWGQYEVAADMHSHAREWFSRLGDRLREAMAWNNLGMALTELHRLSEAVHAHSSAQQTFAELRDHQREATAWINLGGALTAASEYDAAANAYVNAAELFAEHQDPHGEASAWHNVAVVLIELGEFETASNALSKCEAAYVALGGWYDVGRVRLTIARLHTRQGRHSEATSAWESAAEAYERAKAPEEAAKARRRAQA
ncbi:ATP-binding protein [Streptomyces tricolor]